MGADSEYVYEPVKQRIVSGVDVIEDLPRYLADLGAQRTMVVCGPNILSSDVIKRVEAATHDTHVGRFDGAAPHTPLEVVADALELVAELQPDTILTVGGGSTHTVGKGLALLRELDAGAELTDYELRFVPPSTVLPPPRPLPPVTTNLVALPTTMGCAEIGRSGGGFYDRRSGRKVIVAGTGSTSPRTILIDGRALATTPTPVQTSTAVGQLRIALESYNNRKANAFGDGFALHAIRLLVKRLVGRWQVDPASLLEIKTACSMATLAGAAVGPLGLNSAIAHQLGAIHDIPHGVANGVLLAHTVTFTGVELTPDRLQLLADAMGVESSARRQLEAIARRIEFICRVVELPTTLRELAVGRGDLPRIAEATMHDRALSGSPRSIRSSETIMEILEKAW